jgi:hydrogenase small subunit
MADDGLYAALVRRGMSRRSFLKFSTAMAAALALPASYAPRIAEAVAAAPRLPVIWLRGQDCAGETEAFLRAPNPSTVMLLLDLLSLEYHETLMAPVGAAAELSLTGAMERYPNGYIAVVEGSIPTAAGGAYCLVAGRPFADIAREVCDGALATIAVGGCAVDGGLPGAGGGVTDARGVREVVSGGTVINLPGCPVNVENLVATIVNYLTFKEWPAMDPMGRPLFAYGNLIHNECERRPHFEFGEFSMVWGDEGAQKGWCLYKLGCKGPESFGNCASKQFAEGTSWPVRAGHGCVGCTMPNFWDAMSPFYRRLPSPLPFFPNLTADGVGTALVGGVGALAVVHGAGMAVRMRRKGRLQRKAAMARAVDGSGGSVAVAEQPATTSPAEAPGTQDTSPTGTQPTDAEVR